MLKKRKEQANKFVKDIFDELNKYEDVNTYFQSIYFTSKDFMANSKVKMEGNKSVTYTSKDGEKQLFISRIDGNIYINTVAKKIKRWCEIKKDDTGVKVELLSHTNDNRSNGINRPNICYHTTIYQYDNNLKMVSNMDEQVTKYHDIVNNKIIKSDDELIYKQLVTVLDKKVLIKHYVYRDNFTTNAATDTFSIDFNNMNDNHNQISCTPNWLPISINTYDYLLHGGPIDTVIANMQAVNDEENDIENFNVDPELSVDQVYSKAPRTSNFTYFKK